VRVRIVVLGVADPPHSGRCLARATAEAVGVAPGLGIDTRIGPGIDPRIGPGIDPRIGPGIDPGMNPGIDPGQLQQYTSGWVRG